MVRQAILQSSNSTLESKIIQKTIENLIKVPSMLAKFIIDLEKGAHRQWIEYKRAKSDIMMDINKGRSTPVTKGRPSGNPQFGLIYDRQKRGVTFIPQIRLEKCRTLKEKVNKIMAVNCEKEVKMDLIKALV